LIEYALVNFKGPQRAIGLIQTGKIVQSLHITRVNLNDSLKFPDRQLRLICIQVDDREIVPIQEVQRIQPDGLSAVLSRQSVLAKG